MVERWLKPIRIDHDACAPIPETGGHDKQQLRDERVPVVEDELPDVLSRIEFWAFGRQCQQRDGGGNPDHRNAAVQHRPEQNWCRGLIPPSSGVPNQSYPINTSCASPIKREGITCFAISISYWSTAQPDMSRLRCLGQSRFRHCDINSKKRTFL